MSINANNAALNEILETINELPNSKEEQEKTVDITENGTTEVTPDEGMSLSKVTVNVDVPTGGGEFVGIKWLEVNENGYPTVIDASKAPTTNYLCYQYSDVVEGRSTYFYTKEAILPIDTTVLGMCAFRYCKSLLKPPKIYDNLISLKESCFDNCTSLEIDYLPPNVEIIDKYVFRNCTKISISRIPESVKNIDAAAFNKGWINTNHIIFEGTPQTIANNAFMSNSNITDIYVPWSEGEVANAPWGATNATIHYNATYDENGNPIVTEE